MFIDQLLLGVLLVVTLAVLYMLYRFYSLIKEKSPPTVVKNRERPPPKEEDVEKPV